MNKYISIILYGEDHKCTQAEEDLVRMIDEDMTMYCVADETYDTTVKTLADMSWDWLIAKTETRPWVTALYGHQAYTFFSLADDSAIEMCVQNDGSVLYNLLDSHSGHRLYKGEIYTDARFARDSRLTAKLVGTCVNGVEMCPTVLDYLTQEGYYFYDAQSLYEVLESVTERVVQNKWCRVSEEDAEQYLCELVRHFHILKFTEAPEAVLTHTIEDNNITLNLESVFYA